MKKLLLAACCFTTVISWAQQSKKPLVTYSVNPNVVMDKRAMLDNLPNGAIRPSFKTNGNQLSGLNTAEALPYTVTKVGQSNYDLQTNASIGRRVQLHADGSVSVVWTTANDADPWNERGTGYNFKNQAGTWLNPPTNDVRIENPGQGTNYRTGWPNIGEFASGKEWVMGHTPNTDGGFRITTNSSLGSNTWTSGNVILAGTGGIRPIWSRTANNGNIFHCISNSNDTAPRLNGVRSPTMYSRSVDGGITWIQQLIALPNYDNTRIYEGGGDSYAIDVRDSIVAIVIGGLGEDVMLWKSTDNGNTFIKSIIDSFPFAPYDSRKVIGQNVWTNDGSVDVLIDNAGKVHVFWGGSRVSQTNASSDSAFFTPATALLFHKEEGASVPDTIGYLMDINGDTSIVLGTDILGSTWQRTPGGNFIGAARYGNTSLVTMPSAGIDAAGTIYCVFSAPVETHISDNEENFRDVFIVYKKVGSAWSEPQNLSQDAMKEDVFGCIAKRVDANVHLIWQKDIYAGTNLQNADPTDINEIMYAAIPTSLIQSNTIGVGPNGFAKINPVSSFFTVYQNQPNPSKGTTEIRVSMKQNADLNLKVTNLLGQTIYEEKAGKVEAGEFSFRLNTSAMAKGVYFYTVTAGNAAQTLKMIVD